MSTVSFIRRCQEAGMDLDTALLAAAAFEAELKLAVDAILEPRRAKDRARKAKVPRNSAEAVEFQESAEPLSPALSPQTPQTHPHTRESVTTREGREREEAAFGRFWQAYPRKTAKADARKAFGRAWRKLPPTDEESILAGGLERAKAGWDDPQFIPHAATWLNHERWTDEPPTPCTRTPNGNRPHHDNRPTAREDRLGRSLAGLMAAVDEREPRLG